MLVRRTLTINRPLTTNTINTNNNTFTSGTGSITGGALSCTTINTNNNTFTSGTGTITPDTAGAAATDYDFKLILEIAVNLMFGA